MIAFSQMEPTMITPNLQGPVRWEATLPRLDPDSSTIFRDMLNAAIVLEEDFHNLPGDVKEKISCCEDTDLWRLLQEHRLLTQYQADRVQSGKTYGLILGQYRVLDRLGAGGMGIVFKAEHMDMRRLVAIKVLPLYPEQNPQIQQRFVTEIRVVAQLQHPNIVTAMDSGIVSAPGEVSLRYFVMELVQGEDLEEMIHSQGPLPVAKACDIIHQVANALGEAHKHQLVHRDIKPSNIRVTPEGQAKLLDFGLTRQFNHRLTQPGIILGTLDFMAPEQAYDAGSVDIRADIYGLGATLFWCLTGKAPFPHEDNLIAQIAQRHKQPPPLARALRPEIPNELDGLLQQMMAIDPTERPATPKQVIRELLSFVKPDLVDAFSASGHQAISSSEVVGAKKILVVDDQPEIAQFCRLALTGMGMQCDDAGDGPTALNMVQAKKYDLVLLDIQLPGIQGPQVCKLLRESQPGNNMKIIMMSGQATADEMAKILLKGADDYLSKPISMVQLHAKAKFALRLKDAQDRADHLNARLREVNATLEQTLGARNGDIIHLRNGVIQALAKLVEHREGDKGAHLERMEQYTRCLAESAAKDPAFAGQIDAAFIDMLACCAPLHDIGKVGLPDHILLKPGKLDADERLQMQTHTIIGSETLRSIMRKNGESLAFLHMAADIARHHHERFDGTGYPDNLAGADIPLSARIVTLADVYDALRSRRSYKPALSHASTVGLITQGCGSQFDPDLIQVFQRCADRLEAAFRAMPN